LQKLYRVLGEALKVARLMREPAVVVRELIQTTAKLEKRPSAPTRKLAIGCRRLASQRRPPRQDFFYQSSNPGSPPALSHDRQPAHFAPYALRNSVIQGPTRIRISDPPVGIPLAIAYASSKVLASVTGARRCIRASPNVATRGLACCDDASEMRCASSAFVGKNYLL
jgi:hypothetical protein